MSVCSHLGWIKVWNGGYCNIRPEIMVLANISALVGFVHIIEESGFAYEYIGENDKQ